MSGAPQGRELQKRFERVKALATTPNVTFPEARVMAESVSGLARLSGYSRMHVHRLVKAKRLKLGTQEALRWSWNAAKRNYPSDIPPMNLRKNHPARRAMVTLIKEWFPSSPRTGGGEVDMKVVALVVRNRGEPNPDPIQLKAFISEARELQDGAPDLVRRTGITRRRKQVDYSGFLWALNRLEEKQQRPTFRNIGREIGVNASTVSRWFGPNGHLRKYRDRLTKISNSPVVGTGHARNGRPLRLNP